MADLESSAANPTGAGLATTWTMIAAATARRASGNVSRLTTFRKVGANVAPFAGRRSISANTLSTTTDANTQDQMPRRRRWLAREAHREEGSGFEGEPQVFLRLAPAATGRHSARPPPRRVICLLPPGRRAALRADAGPPPRDVCGICPNADRSSISTSQVTGCAAPKCTNTSGLRRSVNPRAEPRGKQEFTDSDQRSLATRAPRAASHRRWSGHQEWRTSRSARCWWSGSHGLTNSRLTPRCSPRRQSAEVSLWCTGDGQAAGC
jgi:hypothetical protein